MTKEKIVRIVKIPKIAIKRICKLIENTSIKEVRAGDILIINKNFLKISKKLKGERK